MSGNNLKAVLSNGYVTRNERDDKYKFVERVYNRLLEKRKKKGI